MHHAKAFLIPMRAICLALALVTNLAMPEASAEPNKEKYELQERCGKRAEEAFQNAYGGGGVSNTETGQNVTTYQNHYSETFNKCFFLEIVTIINYKTQNKGVSTMMTLWDINEKKEYGTFFKRSQDSGADYVQRT